MNKALNKKEALIRIVKRNELSDRAKFWLEIASFLLALFAGGIFILFLGHNPFSVYATMVIGCFKNAMSMQATARIIVPLLITSLGVTMAFKMRFWNIGAEGQIIMGAVFSSYFALFYSHLPHPVLMTIMFIAGALGGGLWALIPGIFKVKFNTNETLFTLMMNYIALYVITLLRDGSWRDPHAAGFPKIATFVANAKLDKVLGVHVGWIIALILVVLIFIYLKYTKQGYEISVVGESTATATYAGMNVKKIVLRTVFLSGAIAGIAGMTQSSGSDATLASGVAGGVGFTAITVSWLAHLNPLGILIISSLFGILGKGSSIVQSSFNISSNSSDILQGIILFFVLAGEFFIRYKFAWKRSNKGGEKA
ncbi:MAG: ABC transporter permease [Lachnospiraceae bacterium]|nr:ABC transporter permease [Lachnospiraceae bacterium]